MMPGNEAVSESEPLDRLMRTLDVFFLFCSCICLLSFTQSIKDDVFLHHLPCSYSISFPHFWDPSPHPELKEFTLWFFKRLFVNPTSFKNHVCRFSFLTLSNFLFCTTVIKAPFVEWAWEFLSLLAPLSPSLISLGKHEKLLSASLCWPFFVTHCCLFWVMSRVKQTTTQTLLKGRMFHSEHEHPSKHLGGLLSPEVSTLEEGGFYHHADWPVLGEKCIANLCFQNMWMAVFCKGFCISGNTKWGKKDSLTTRLFLTF